MKPYSLSLPLAPVLLLQGSYVRKHIIQLPEASGEREGVSGEGPSLNLLVLGDSAAAGVGVPQQDQALLGSLRHRLSHHYSLSWKLLAKTGNTTEDTLMLLNHLPEQSLDMVVISTGVNDITSKIGIQKWLKQVAAIQQVLVARFQAKRIYYTAIPPMGRFPSLPHPLRYYLGRRARLFDNKLKKYVSALENAVHVSFDEGFNESAIAEDGFHPSDVAYQAWSEKVFRLHMGELID